MVSRVVVFLHSVNTRRSVPSTEPNREHPKNATQLPGLTSDAKFDGRNFRP